MQSETAPAQRLAALGLKFLVFAVFQAACGGVVPKPLPSPMPAEPLGLPASTVSPTTTTMATANATAEPTITVAVDAENAAWQTHQSRLGGYSIEHPADWLVDEQPAADGSVVTTFAPAAGGAGISVIIHSSETAGAGSADLPNMRCHAVTVGGLPGVRCLDTINLSTTTIVVANGKTYQIAALGKHVDESLYHRFLETFRLT